MQNNGNSYRKRFLASLVFVALQVSAQNTRDTAYIISSTDEQYSNSPLNLSNNPYYNIIKPNKEGIAPTVLFNRDDRFFAGLNYNSFSEGWRPDSSGRKHRVFAHYSISQNAFSTGYQGIFNKAVGGWNFYIDAGFDWVKWMNFYGLGNETIQETNDRNFYRMRRREGMVSFSFEKRLSKQSSFIIRPFYQYVEVINDQERFLAKGFSSNSSFGKYESNNFGGLRADVQLQKLNDVLLPTKGMVLSAGIAHTRNINSPHFFTNYSAYTRFFFPFLKNFVLSVENGAATLSGEPEFYQYNSIGGNTLRGYRGERFWGQTIFHNNNELQYIFNANSKFFKGEMGLLAFGDQGRVWQKGETSNQWHYGYGGGIMLVPYHKLYLSIQYGVSKERKGIHFELRRTL